MAPIYLIEETPKSHGFFTPRSTGHTTGNLLVFYFTRPSITGAPDRLPAMADAAHKWTPGPYWRKLNWATLSILP